MKFYNFELAKIIKIYYDVVKIDYEPKIMCEYICGGME
jgi:hypothetical protein